MIGLANLLGLLGLLGILGLIIIYIIKPNYQQKFVSSTYVWKLSLKYRKRKINVNKLMNLLLIICQVLILISCALILAQPIIRAQQPPDIDEKIIIIEASGNMLATDGLGGEADVEGGTRFLRATQAAVQTVNETFDNDENGLITIIMAGRTPEVLQFESGVNAAGQPQYTKIQRLGIADKDNIIATLTGLKNSYCTLGSADMEQAMRYADPVLEENPEAKVILYSATEYINEISENSFVDVRADELRLDTEWNAAILDGKSTINSHFVYSFDLEIGLYNYDSDIEVMVQIYGANAADDSEASADDKNGYDLTYTLKTPSLSAYNQPNGQTVTITLDTFSEALKSDGILCVSDKPFYKDDGGEFDGVLTYKSVRVSLSHVGNRNPSTDSLYQDNEFYFYDGQRTQLKVVYESDRSNPFMRSILYAWQSALTNKWDVIIKEVTKNDDVVTEGYDLYIFEGQKLPRGDLPSDGAIILVSPEISALTSVGINTLTSVEIPASDTVWCSVAEHPLSEHLIHAENYVAHDFMQASNYDKEYEVFLNYHHSNGGTEETIPMIFAKNKAEPLGKVMYTGLHMNYTDFAMYTDMSLMFLDVFNWFFPVAVEEHIYEIGEQIVINSFAREIKLKGDDIDTKITEFPHIEVAERTGRYTLTETLLSNKEVETSYYVKMSARESNIWREENELTEPNFKSKYGDEDKDLLVYFAAALVALLFAEWFLHSRNQF